MRINFHPGLCKKYSRWDIYFIKKLKLIEMAVQKVAIYVNKIRIGLMIIVIIKKTIYKFNLGYYKHAAQIARRSLTEGFLKSGHLNLCYGHTTPAVSFGAQPILSDVELCTYCMCFTYLWSLWLRRCLALS